MSQGLYVYPSVAAAIRDGAKVIDVHESSVVKGCVRVQIVTPHGFAIALARVAS